MEDWKIDLYGRSNNAPSPLVKYRHNQKQTLSILVDDVQC